MIKHSNLFMYENFVGALKLLQVFKCIPHILNWNSEVFKALKGETEVPRRKLIRAFIRKRTVLTT